jgi:aryl-alcohol dehydrogenase-like predicted oxidoreductase
MSDRRLGAEGPRIGALGLGTGAMSDSAADRADDAESVATIQAALDAGIGQINTADFYGMGHSEMLIARAIEGRRDKAFISVKYGGLRDPGGAFTGFDNRPVATKNFIAYSLRRLGTDYIDLYQPARVDPAVPIEDTVGAIADLVKAGYVRHIGLSEAGPATIRRAHAVHPIAAVEVEYSLMGRDIEHNVLPAVRDLGIGLVAYSVLSGGLLAGRSSVRQPGAPRNEAGAIEQNLRLVERFREQAHARGATPTQLAIAWVLAKGDDITALVGVRTRARLAEALGALDISLSSSDLTEIEAAVPPDAVVGGLYGGFVREMIRQERGR